MTKDNDVQSKVSIISDDIKEKLINAFGLYYGSEFDQRIISSLKETTFVYVDLINRGDKGYVFSSNEDRMNDKDLIKRIKAASDFTACCFPKTYPPVIAININEKINFNVLIHELNHTLHNKMIQQESFSPLIVIPPKYQEGIMNDDDELSQEDSLDNLCYEIINEYMTREILEIFNKKYNDQLYDCSINPSYYISVDVLLGKVVYNIFEKIKDLIKEHLIKAEGQVIRDMIGKDNYSSLNQSLKDAYNLYTEKAVAYMSKADESIVNMNPLDREEKILKELLQDTDIMKIRNELDLLANKINEQIGSQIIK